jgi:4,5-dihydroxyphthalate decarboxylase
LPAVRDDVSLRWVDASVYEMFRRMLETREFDVSEMSLSSYVLRYSQGDRSMVALPVFPSRLFRHGFIFVNAAAGIATPEDLRGKSIGTTEYQMTAGVWMRGLLSEYGVSPTSVEWVMGEKERVPWSMPPHLRVRHVGGRQEVFRMLEQGEIAAMLAPYSPPAFVEGSSRIRRLFDDVQAQEEAYFRRAGVFPIMHTVVLRRELYAADPSIARAIYDAFAESKRVCLEALRAPNALPYTLPGLLHYVERDRQVFGDDPWPYGVAPNHKTLSTFLHYMYEQGLTERELSPEALFAVECGDGAG